MKQIKINFLGNLQINGKSFRSPGSFVVPARTACGADPFSDSAVHRGCRLRPGFARKTWLALRHRSISELGRGGNGDPNSSNRPPGLGIRPQRGNYWPLVVAFSRCLVRGSAGHRILVGALAGTQVWIVAASELPYLARDHGC